MTDGVDPFAPFRESAAPLSESYVHSLSVTPVTHQKQAGVTSEVAENRDCTPVTLVTQPISKGDKWRARCDEIEAEMRMPSEWAQAFATIEQMPMPRCAEADRWAQVLSDAHAFMWRCAGYAVAAGWKVSDAFGYDPDGATSDVGFILLIDGGQPLVADDGSASVRFDDHRVWFKPGWLSENIPLIWDLDKHRSRGNAQKTAKNRD